MITKPDKNVVRKKRHARVRSKIFGTAERPRLNVYRSINIFMLNLSMMLMALLLQVHQL